MARSKVGKTVENLGEYLREQRENAQLSLRQLAEQTGVSNPYLSQIERGLRKPSAEILQGIADTAQADGYSLFIAASQYDPQREQHIVQTMREHRVDGVILCSASFSPSQSSQFARYGIPIVAVNNQAAEAYRYSIYHDDIDGSRQLTRYLIGLGHQRIAYLGNALSGRTTLDRLDGYRQAMQRAGIGIQPDSTAFLSL